MSNSISSIAYLVEEQIDLVMKEITELKNHFQTGYTLDQYFNETIYAPMTIQQFNDKFEPLNEKLIQLLIQWSEF